MNCSMSTPHDAWRWLATHDYLVDNPNSDFFIIARPPSRAHLDQFVAAVRLLAAWSVDTRTGFRKVRCEHDQKHHYRLRWKVL